MLKPYIFGNVFCAVAPLKVQNPYKSLKLLNQVILFPITDHKSQLSQIMTNKADD